MVFSRALLFFALIAVAFCGSCDISQTCSCDLLEEAQEKRGSCESLYCCESFNGNFDFGDRSVGLREVRSTPLTMSCLCCSCHNVTCETVLDYTSEFEGTATARDAKPEIKTVADAHRSLVEGRKVVKGCYDIEDNCACEAEKNSCSSLDCCEITNAFEPQVPDFRRNFQPEKSPMVMYTGRGAILLECDCCSCQGVDCNNEADIEFDIEVDGFFIEGMEG
eukprot:CAMPEP_0201487364 /NCGR_PEP_ID=MMETSP0151_2-20130828/12629_1 /ASSEMBLY_ACC=CAM_ASM_000257 /TAXON_ID=200890 /ORGANISM="Paramoeba atlantica, Strain 621/1 / CCAP 1560/9" /LENGTH=220 /DNA_ID=CAMNT_0047872371 /DNA_START=56 /DNA_END=718 /DNA_ORIENTATION=+